MIPAAWVRQITTGVFCVFHNGFCTEAYGKGDQFRFLVPELGTNPRLRQLVVAKTEPILVPVSGFHTFVTRVARRGLAVSALCGRERERERERGTGCASQCECECQSECERERECVSVSVSV